MGGVRGAGQVRLIPPAGRVTVALVPEAAAALAALRERTGLSGTHLVNRAVSLYAFTEQQLAAGREVLLRSPDGTTQLVQLL